MVSTGHQQAVTPGILAQWVGTQEFDTLALWIWCNQTHANRSWGSFHPNTQKLYEIQQTFFLYFKVGKVVNYQWTSSWSWQCVFLFKTTAFLFPMLLCSWDQADIFFCSSSYKHLSRITRQCLSVETVSLYSGPLLKILLLGCLV